MRSGAPAARRRSRGSLSLRRPWAARASKWCASAGSMHPLSPRTPRDGAVSDARHARRRRPGAAPSHLEVRPHHCHRPASAWAFCSRFREEGALCTDFFVLSLPWSWGVLWKSCGCARCSRPAFAKLHGAARTYTARRPAAGAGCPLAPAAADARGAGGRRRQQRMRPREALRGRRAGAGTARGCAAGRRGGRRGSGLLPRGEDGADNLASLPRQGRGTRRVRLVRGEGRCVSD